MFEFIKKKLETRQSEFFYPVGSRIFNSVLDHLVLSAISFYTNPIKELPLYVHTEDEKLKDHNLSYLLNKPSSKMNRALFYSRIAFNVLYSGNAFARIFDNNGIPNELHLFYESNDIQSYQDERDYNSDIFYRDQKSRVILAEDMLHFRLETGSSYLGSPKIKTIQELLDEMRTSFQSVLKYSFQGRGILQGLSNSQNKEEVAKLKRRLTNFFSNGNFNILTLDTGQDLKNFSPDFKVKEFVEIRRVLRREIYNLFGVNSIIASDSDSGGGSQYKSQTEALSIFTRTHLSPFLATIESELSDKLLTDEEKRADYKIRFDLSELLRGDQETLYTNLQKALGQKPFLTINEARSLLGFDPLLDGDKIPSDEKQGESNGSDQTNNQTNSTTE